MWTPQHQIQNETDTFSRESPIKNRRAQDRHMKTKVRCKLSKVSGVQYCCHEQWGKCAVGGSGVKSLEARKLGMKILWSP